MEQENRKFLSQEELEQLQHEAEQGDAEAQYQLGICYANGYGVTIDQITAVEYFLMLQNRIIHKLCISWEIVISMVMEYIATIGPLQIVLSKQQS